MSRFLNSVILSGFLAASLWGGMPAQAQSQSKVANNNNALEKFDPVLMKIFSDDNPYREMIKTRARAMIAPLGQAEIEYLYELKSVALNIFYTREAISFVQRSYGFCRDDNSEMSQELGEVLEKKINPLKKSYDELDKKLVGVIGDLTVTTPKKFESYLEAYKQAHNYAEKLLNKIISTSPANCKALMNNADKFVADMGAVHDEAEKSLMALVTANGKALDKSEGKTQNKPSEGAKGTNEKKSDKDSEGGNDKKEDNAG
jgi:uncharacterized protein YueI